MSAPATEPLKAIPETTIRATKAADATAPFQLRIRHPQPTYFLGPNQAFFVNRPALASMTRIVARYPLLVPKQWKASPILSHPILLAGMCNGNVVSPVLTAVTDEVVRRGFRVVRGGCLVGPVLAMSERGDV